MQQCLEQFALPWPVGACSFCSPMLPQRFPLAHMDSESGLALCSLPVSLLQPQDYLPERESRGFAGARCSHGECPALPSPAAHTSLQAVLISWGYHGPILYFVVWSLVCSLLRLLCKLQNTQSCCTSVGAPGSDCRLEHCWVPALWTLLCIHKMGENGLKCVRGG